MAEGATFHGVDVGWMQAQWRDCRDKAEQLKIFRDMVGKSVPVQEILDVVGEPEYCGPMEPVKRQYRRFTEEDDALIVRMKAEGCTNKKIGEALNRSTKAVSVRIAQMRGKGVCVPGPKSPKAPIGKDAFGQIEGFLSGMLEREEELLDRLAEVRAEIAEYRKNLKTLLELSGGTDEDPV